MRHPVVGHDDVRPAVPVEVVEGNPEALARVGTDTAALRHVGKGSVPVVPIEQVGNGGEVFGVAIGAEIGTAAEDVVEIPLHIAADEQVQVSIAVVVEESGAAGPAAAADAGRLAHVPKSPVALVVKELVRGEVGEVEIGPAVVVVVPDGHAHGIAAAAHPGLFGGIAEAPVAVVSIEPVPVVGRGFFRNRSRDHAGGQLGPVQQVDVQEPVPVVIQQCDSRTHGLQQELLRRGG